MAFVVSPRRGQELAGSAIDAGPARGLVQDLVSPHPIGAQLPAAFQEDEFCQRMMLAFDEMLAPVFNTLDCFDAYLDPALAPPDFVDWLAGWVGVDIDETWTPERRRRLIEEAVVLYRIRGTAAGLAAHVQLYAGATPQIEENGACGWSQTANSEMPGSAQPRLSVRLAVDDDAGVRRSTVARIIDASRPAHVPFELEIVAGGHVQAPAEEEAAGGAADAPGAVDLPGSEHIELAPQAPESAEETEGTGDGGGSDGPEASG